MSKDRQGFRGEVRCPALNSCNQVGILAAQKNIRLPFCLQPARYGGETLLPQALGCIQFLLEQKIVRVNGKTEGPGAHRVLVTGIDTGMAGQGHNLVVKGVEHLLRSAFKESAASSQEKSIPAKERPFGEVNGVAPGMTRNMDRPYLPSTEFDPFSVLQSL